MILITCVDDRYGMSFNHRRQSSDKSVTDQILILSNGEKMWMNGYSRSIFPDGDNVCVSDDFLIKACAGEFCFVENESIAPYIDRVEKIILFRWNRAYPFDLQFPVGELNKNWRLSRTESFVGTSHECITREEYCR